MSEPANRIEKLNPSAKASAGNAVMRKIGMIVLLIGGLLIPLWMISGVIYERQNRKDQVTQEIADTWGKAQTVIGPVLVVPYKIMHTTVNAKGEKQTQTSTDLAYLLPRQYKVTNDLKPETRYRGIYNSVVYTSNLAANGEFDLRDFHELKIPDENFVWKDAFVIVSLPQPKGIQTPPSLHWQGKSVEVLPGTHGAGLFDIGLYAPVVCSPEAQTIPFSFKLTVRGSEAFSLVPIGKQNKLEITGNWPTPSFTGSILPTARTVAKEGFSASWEIPYFARNYPQTFIPATGISNLKLADSQVGVSLYVPVDFYRQADRAIKYGILFLTLTFATYFLFEILGKFRLHPFQYLLVGCALCLFYLLLIAFAEVIGFNFAYLIASVAIIGSITMYSQAIIGKARKHGQFVIAGLLTILYGFLYMLLQLEDLSLLFGTIGLFLVLAVIMYVTRNIDWYNEQVS